MTAYRPAREGGGAVLEVVKFGRWPSSEGAQPSPIAWLVLERRDDGSALLVSRDLLERMPYTNENRSVTWADCDLRTWLNGPFLLEAFDAGERARIAESRIDTSDNPESGTRGGPATCDRVFLLSREEAQRCFADDEQRKSQASQLAVAHGCCSNWWWLRSPGEFQSTPDVVLGDGRIYNCSGHCNFDLVGVRPAIVLRIG